MKPTDLYQGSTGEKRSRDLFIFVRVAIVMAMLMVLCAGLSECRGQDAAVCRTPECGNFTYIYDCRHLGLPGGRCPTAEDFKAKWINPPELDAQIKALEKRIETLEKKNKEPKWIGCTATRCWKDDGDAK